MNMINGTIEQAKTSVFQGVNAKIDIHYPFAITELRQSFTNTKKTDIEGIYQFPLPKEAGFLGFSVVLNGETYEGVIKQKQQAENDYEQAISDGNTSILLEQVQEGLYQINVGNLAPGDKVEFTLRVATLLELSSCTARYFMPTVIAPRYGDNPYRDFNGLRNDFFAEHDFKGTLSLCDNLSSQRFEVSMSLHKTKAPNTYSFGGLLDRDFVISFAMPPRVNPVAMYAEKEGEHFGLCALPSFIKLEQQAANVQLVIDCSGSMGGVAIAQVKEGLEAMFETFEEHDRVNLIKFGSHVEEVLSEWGNFSGKTRTHLRREVASLDANMGGTELIRALETAIDKAVDMEQSQILLLTDGQVWQREGEFQALLKRANRHGIVISAIGLGNAVNESFLSELTDKTSGNLVLINSSENTAQRVKHHLSLLKTSFGQQAIDVNSDCEWSNIATRCLDKNSSVSYFHGLSSIDKPLAIHQVSNSHQSHQTMTWNKADKGLEEAIVALVANNRIVRAESSERAALAEKYQQITDETSFVMVAERDEQSLNGLPEIEHVPQMAVDRVSLGVEVDHCMDILTVVNESRIFPKEIEANYDCDEGLSDATFLEKGPTEHLLEKLSRIDFNDSDSLYSSAMKIFIEEHREELLRILKSLSESERGAYLAEFVLRLQSSHSLIISQDTIKSLKKVVDNFQKAGGLQERVINDMVDCL